MYPHAKPQTLVQIAGLSSRPGPPGSSLLVMIDAQREYTRGLLPLLGIDAAMEEGARGTELAVRIRTTRRGELVIAGFATHMCVSATARSVLEHGFRSTAVAAATRALPHPFGAGVTPAGIIQSGTLAALSDRFAVVIKDTLALGREWGQAVRVARST